MIYRARLMDRAIELRDWMLLRGHSKKRANRFAREYTKRQLIRIRR